MLTSGDSQKSICGLVFVPRRKLPQAHHILQSVTTVVHITSHSMLGEIGKYWKYAFLLDLRT